MDGDGSFSVGVSTSGTALKMPGRTGDSPIIGAGNYADNEAGAAACTGRGELAIRICLAKNVVDLMRNGLEAREACIRGIKKILALEDPLGGGMNLIALDRDGRVGGASVAPDVVYYYQDEKMDRPERRWSVRVQMGQDIDDSRSALY
jgi:beta-aspartyl-peptidase (threonine type)